MQIFQPLEMEEKQREGGMLTIMISDANPGISPSAPPLEETGYYQPPTSFHGQPIREGIGVTS